MTSTVLVCDEIKRFLRGKTPEVLCVTGKWGVGKTFVWKSGVEALQTEKGLGLKRYAYVSLFGLDSLDDLKTAIIGETVDEGSIGKVPDLAALSAPRQWWSSAVGFATRIGQAVPGVREYVLDASNLLFSLIVRNQIVCIDDLERAGDGLTAKTVLGLATFLKEEKKCRVVLLLNQDALQDTNKEDFETQIEKVIDTRLEFRPSPSDAAAIAIQGSSRGEKLLSEYSVKLGIINIRVIQKLKRLALRLEEILGNHPEEVLTQAIHSMTLLGWMVYQPVDAPPLNALTEYDPWKYVIDKKEPPLEEKAWRAIFGAYKFTRLDDFDKVILRGVQSGYFEVDALLDTAKAVALQVEMNKKNSEFHAAWRKYHRSLDDNTAEVLDEIEATFKASVEFIPQSDISGTVNLFKELGQPDRGKALIDLFMAQNAAQPKEFFDMSKYHFAQGVADPDVKAAFKSKLESIIEPFDPYATLKRITEQGGWNPDEVEGLASISVAEYRTLFKTPGEENPMGLVETALKFGSFNAGSHEKIIAEKAVQALQVIAAESPINALRLRRFEIYPPAQPPENL